MSSTTSSLVKPISMANGCLTSHPSLFTTKASYPFLSIPSKPIKFHQLSSSSSWVFPKKKNPSLSVITLVAQTSDWAQNEENVAVEEGFSLGVSEDEEGSEVEGGEEETEESGSGDFYPEPPEEAKLFVGNLPFDFDHNQLAELFNEAGVVETAEVIYNRETGQSRGFGFVVMATVEEAEKAIEQFNRYDVNGRALTVNKAGPRGSRPERPARQFGPSFRIYVGNLSWQVDDARLEQVFSEHGKVVDAKVIYDRETGRSRGFGFVTMASQAELDDAIAAMDGQNVDGRDIRVNVAEERPRRTF